MSFIWIVVIILVLLIIYFMAKAKSASKKITELETKILNNVSENKVIIKKDLNIPKNLNKGSHIQKNLNKKSINDLIKSFIDNN